MIFISKKSFEREIRARVEKELCKYFENKEKEDAKRELHRKIGFLEQRLEAVEDKLGIPHEATSGFLI